GARARRLRRATALQFPRYPDLQGAWVRRPGHRNLVRIFWPGEVAARHRSGARARDHEYFAAAGGAEADGPRRDRDQIDDTRAIYRLSGGRSRTLGTSREIAQCNGKLVLLRQKASSRRAQSLYCAFLGLTPSPRSISESQPAQ